MSIILITLLSIPLLTALAIADLVWAMREISDKYELELLKKDEKDYLPRYYR